jgi:hypothetical protein
MNKFLGSAIAVVLVITSSAKMNAQTIVSYPRNSALLRPEESSVIVVKREVTPGVVTFTRQNGCLLQNPVSRDFLNNGTILETSIRLAASGNSVPQWRNEYRKPWQSALTDYEGGEQKMMLFQFGKHPSTLIKVEESDEKILEAETACAATAYKIFGSNLRLLKPITEQRYNSFSLSLKENWDFFRSKSNL